MTPRRTNFRPRLLTFLGVAAALSGLMIGGMWGLPLVLLGVLVLLAATYSPGDGFLLLGPFAHWELVHSAKRRWIFLWRSLVALGVLVIVGSRFAEPLSEGSVLQPREISQLASESFEVTGMCLVAMVGIYAVMFLPTVVVEERETKRLEHLFVTDLRNHEILLGKVVGRLMVPLVYVLAALPVLAILTFLGGIEPNNILLLGGVLLPWLAGFTGIAMACSVIAKKSQRAVVAAFGVAWLFQILATQANRLALIPGMPSWAISALDTVRLWSVSEISASIRTSQGPEILTLIRHFAAGQFIVLAIGWFLAIRLLRRDGRTDGGATARQLRRLTSVAAYRPPVWDYPIIWYELTTPSTFISRWGNRLFLNGWWLPALIVAIVTAVSSIDMQPGRDSVLRIIFMCSGFFAWVAICLPIGWQACRAIARERQMDTLESLLLTDLEPREILSQKWWSVILAARARFAVFVAFWWTAVLTGHGHVGDALALMAMLAVYSCCVASIGIMLTINAKTGNAAFSMMFFLWLGWFFTIGVCASCLMATPVGSFLAAVTPPLPLIVAGFASSSSNGAALLLPLVGLGFLVTGVVSLVAYRIGEQRFLARTRPKGRVRRHENDG